MGQLSRLYELHLEKLILKHSPITALGIIFSTHQSAVVIMTLLHVNWTKYNFLQTTNRIISILCSKTHVFAVAQVMQQ